MITVRPEPGTGNIPVFTVYISSDLWLVMDVLKFIMTTVK